MFSMVKVVNKDSYHYMTVSNLQPFSFSNQSLHVLHICLSSHLVGKSHLFILFCLGKEPRKILGLVINKGGGSGSLKLPKMCVFGLKTAFFGEN